MFHLLYGGCHTRHEPPFELSRPKGLNHFVLLLVKTRAEFHIGNTSLYSYPDSAVIISPHTPYAYASPDSPYMDDWIHFTCDPDDFPETSGFPLDTFIPLENISRFTTFLQQILWEQNYTPEKYRADNVHALFQVLMRNIFVSYQEQSSHMTYTPYRIRLRSLRLSLLAAPYEKYELKEIAGQMGVSISYFQHLYSDTFGISFRADLISMRIEYAKELIQNTNLTIEEIAEQSGYTSEVHFYRQFRKETGFTPASFRSISR
ncbi:MAG: AraC family transcriptional regulator [Eubacteriales bacterium]|nr:AraC family transcriptional regulator [Eubacteriales bacterium]